MLVYNFKSNVKVSHNCVDRKFKRQNYVLCMPQRAVLVRASKEGYCFTGYYYNVRAPYITNIKVFYIT